MKNKKTIRKLIETRLRYAFPYFEREEKNDQK